MGILSCPKGRNKRRMAHKDADCYLPDMGRQFEKLDVYPG